MKKKVIFINFYDEKNKFHVFVKFDEIMKMENHEKMDKKIKLMGIGDHLRDDVDLQKISLFNKENEKMDFLNWGIALKKTQKSSFLGEGGDFPRLDTFEISKINFFGSPFRKKFSSR